MPHRARKYIYTFVIFIEDSAGVPNQPASSFGRWSAAELVETARANLGVGADDKVAPVPRFIAGIAKLIRRRLARVEAADDSTQRAVFLLEPNPPQRTGAPIPRVPTLSDGLTALTGRLWFVAAAVQSGRYIETSSVGDDELFRLVTDKLGLGEAPAIIFNPQLPNAIRFYPNGLGAVDCCEEISIADADVTLEDIFRRINAVYRTVLVTPSAQPGVGRLWANGNKGWASAKAEGIVQMALLSGLAAAFPTCTIRPEQTMPEGRLDLEIERADPLDPATITRFALLELKVLRGFGSKGTPVSDEFNRGWVESGVRQAAAYGAGRGARALALCCFDMRREDTGESCFDDVRDLAREFLVELRRWFLYSSAKRYQSALTAC